MGPRSLFSRSYGPPEGGSLGNHFHWVSWLTGAPFPFQRLHEGFGAEAGRSPVQGSQCQTKGPVDVLTLVPHVQDLGSGSATHSLLCPEVLWPRLPSSLLQVTPDGSAPGPTPRRVAPEQDSGPSPWEEGTGASVPREVLPRSDLCICQGGGARPRAWMPSTSPGAAPFPLLRLRQGEEWKLGLVRLPSSASRNGTVCLSLPKGNWGIWLPRWGGNRGTHPQTRFVPLGP